MADVDTQLQRVGRDDAEQLPVGQRPLDPPPILRRVTGPIGGEPPRFPRVVAFEPFPSIAIHQLAARPALGKHDRTDTA